MPDQREAYLDQACGGDQELRQQVARLLKAHAVEGSLLDGGSAGVNATALFETIPEACGTVIGPYKLMEQIGEGGMGVVYVAEQTQPVRRKVALKVIKPGMDTRQVIARFEAERQALAMMDHPNIAKVLDGGDHRVGPALLRHGAGPRRAHHRVLRRRAALDPANGWSCSCSCAGPCSTPTRRGSSTAT